MSDSNLKRASHALSQLLRHGAGEVGLPMDAAGWAPIDDVLRRARMSRATLDVVVRTNNKSRLQVDGDRIRCCQGHSLQGMPVTREALEASWEEDRRIDPIWHGTNQEALESIAREGLLPGGRTHVHLAEETDSRVGKRAGVGVLLRVDPVRLREQGVGLYRSPNGVLLARTVPPDCITGLMAVSDRAKKDEPKLRALFSYLS